MHYVYVLRRGKDDSLYIGYTSDLKRRFAEHTAKYPCKIIYYESYSSSKHAREREKKLKQYGSAWRSLRDRII